MTAGLTIAGRYRLLAKLGEGGMGAVWRAEHLTLGTHVAIKLIDPVIARSEEALARFRREAQAAAELRSVHVVHILDYGVEDGTPYIAMELLEGESLAQRLDRVKRFTPSELVTLFTQVGRALTRAHQQNIIHRDLKPDNIYLVKDGDDEIAKVLDFGIAKKLGLKSTSSGIKTQTGAMLGTPYYMSPEQARAQASIDHRTDIWSLAIIAYECLTGFKPFDGDTLASLLVSICTDPLPAPSTVASVPPGFDAWFARAASRDVNQRFASVSEAIKELRQALGVEDQGRPTLTTASSEVHPGMAPAGEFGSTGGPSALTIGTPTKNKSRRLVAVGTGLVVLLGLGLAAARLINASAPATSNASATPDVSSALMAKSSEPAPLRSTIAPPSAPAPVGSASPPGSGEPTPSTSTAPTAEGAPPLTAAMGNKYKPSPNPHGAAGSVKPTDKGKPQPKRDYDKSVGF
jgi:serine/threonine-protein kinase